MGWIALTLFYGIVKGAREIVKKKALELSTVMEVLFFYTLIGFLLLLPEAGHVWGMTPKMYLLVAVKSFVIFVAWLCGFYAIKRIPVSVYGVLDLSRVLFSTTLGVIVIGEQPGMLQNVGMCLVISGLVLLGLRKDRKTKKTKAEEVPPEGTAADLPEETGGRTERKPFRESMPCFVILAFLSAFLNAVSGTMDKVLTIRVGITSAQLQFWYMLYLLVFYGLFIVAARTPVRVKQTAKNYWIWILSILFIAADRALFIANSYPESRVTVMTLLEQAGAVVTIVAGRFVFHEKGTAYKLLCAGVIVAGIVLGTI